MGIFNLYSKRQNKLLGNIPEIFIYEIPQKLRVQIIHILEDSIGRVEYSDDYYKLLGVYEFFHNTLCREYGKFELLRHYNDIKQEVQNFFLECDSDEALDFIELAFRYINIIMRDLDYSYKSKVKIKMQPDEAIIELNERFKENGVGFSFENGEIIKVDSTYVHTEITKPTISLLWNKIFKGANEEYLKAHEHYREGRNKECLADCLKAFESTMKIICTEKKWAFNTNDTSKKLIQVCFQNNLIPTFTQNQFTSLQNLLESGIPTIRNKLGGHGQGQTLQKVDDEMTRYALNLTGSNIIFLVEQSNLINDNKS